LYFCHSVYLSSPVFFSICHLLSVSLFMSFVFVLVVVSFIMSLLLLLLLLLLSCVKSNLVSSFSVCVFVVCHFIRSFSTVIIST